MFHKYYVLKIILILCYLITTLATFEVNDLIAVKRKISSKFHERRYIGYEFITSYKIGKYSSSKIIFYRGGKTKTKRRKDKINMKYLLKSFLYTIFDPSYGGRIKIKRARKKSSKRYDHPTFQYLIL